MRNSKLPVKIAFLLVRALGESHFCESIEFKLKSSQSEGTATLKGILEESQDMVFWGPLVDQFQDIKYLWKDAVKMDLDLSIKKNTFTINIKAK